MKIVLITLLAGLLSCTSVHAGDLFIGASFGIASGGEDAVSLNKQLEDKGIIATATTNGDIREAWQVFLAYQFLERWGVELAYVDLGEATIGFEGIDQDINDILDKIGDNHPRSAQGTKVTASYRFELNKKLQLQSKLGVFLWDTEYTFSGVTDTGELVSRHTSFSGEDVTAGFGLIHKLTDNISANLAWDYYSIDGEPINMFTFGAIYQFY